MQDTPISRTRYMQENRKMRFEQAYEEWKTGRLTQSEAALLPGQGKHRIKRERAPLEGMMMHQDASTHRWVPGAVWDLVVTMDDATGVHTSMFFCGQEGSASSFHGIGQTMARYGLFASLYTDRGARYFTTPVAGGKVDKAHLTQVGRALKQLGIEHIAAYSPQARGRSERAFQTHQGRLPQELARAGITDMDSANRYLDALRGFATGAIQVNRKRTIRLLSNQTFLFTADTRV